MPPANTVGQCWLFLPCKSEHIQFLFCLLSWVAGCRDSRFPFPDFLTRGCGSERFAVRYKAGKRDDGYTFWDCGCPWFWREHSWYFLAPPQSYPWLPDSAISIVYLLSNLKRRVFNGHLPLPFPQLLSPDSLPHCHTENLLPEGRVAFVLLLLEWTLEVCKGWGGGL